jgi:hypothetical protein
LPASLNECFISHHLRQKEWSMKRKEANTSSKL